MFRNKLFVICCVAILLSFVYHQYSSYRDTKILNDQTIETTHNIDVSTGQITNAKIKK